ncbi:FAD-dependent thymidylate synthase [Sphaerobacter sp.]|uniref:FAD-dependent thymidylate synthase n=1 Tax=Sphaerobacter sp. TaxID=2099654 RepID=UPI001D8A213A|nr:FAD-dependent thymidylate synthase [Sphaerobacter sp.]MBX5446596.1 FAD-dependent thymidylate synthase [Sphaerobacter sp.]
MAAPADRQQAFETPFPFRSTPPTVRLIAQESAHDPFALTVAAAWTCYGARPARVENVLKLMDSSLDEPGDEVRPARRERAQRLYPDLFAAGHHTTFQHANFVFVLDGVSRLAIWSFFHSHPHYNSEQVSQRYREVSGKTMVTPDLPEPLLEIYTAAIERALEGYRRLVDLLTPDLTARYARVFPARAKARDPETQERVRRDVQRKAQEVARYVLPLATPAHLYHTVNGLTLLRYYVLANQLDVPGEVRYIVNRMVEEVLKVDPNFLGAPGHPLDLRLIATEDTPEYQALANLRANLDQTGNEEFFREFDAELGDYHSKLVAYNPNAEHLLASAVRTVLGRSRDELSDAEAIALVLDPARNHYHGHSLFLAMHSKLMQTMNHVAFTFQKRISGAEEAQNQRHRGTLSSSPVLSAHLRQEPDVIVPYDVARVPEALEEYHATVRALWDAKNRLLDAGVPVEQVLYLLPNSHHVRFYETGTLLTYFWKWVKRLCYDAQREIFETARQETEQVKQVLPEIGRYVARPPCMLRHEAGTRPFCPEGERYCGIPVWRNYDFARIAERRVL